MLRDPLKTLIWVYFILWLIEGALRKWILPGLSEPLLIIRDPLVMLIYVIALGSGRMPLQRSVYFIVAMAMLALAFGQIAGAPTIVTIYGVRINFLHLPFVFVVAQICRHEDVVAIGRFTLWATPFVVLLMLAQYQGGEFSRLNVGAGGEIGAQLRGSLGRVRPSGPFSFISGSVLWCSLATAFTVYGWQHKGTYPRFLLIACTVALVVAVPISISRMLMFSMLLVVLFGLATAVKTPRLAFTLVIPAVVVGLLLNLLGGGELTESFSARWEDSTESGIQNSIIDRVLRDYTVTLPALAKAELFGVGAGMGSNFGARYVSGSMGFLLAEAEWPKIVLELGPLLGLAFIGMRTWVSWIMVRGSFGALTQSGDGLAWLVCGASLLPMLSGQWAPPTIMGFAVFGAGLTLAAANPAVIEDDEMSDAEVLAEAEIPEGRHRASRRIPRERQ